MQLLTLREPLHATQQQTMTATMTLTLRRRHSRRGRLRKLPTAHDPYRATELRLGPVRGG